MKNVINIIFIVFFFININKLHVLYIIIRLHYGKIILNNIIYESD